MTVVSRSVPAAIIVSSGHEPQQREVLRAEAQRLPDVLADELAIAARAAACAPASSSSRSSSTLTARASELDTVGIQPTMLPRMLWRIEMS